MSKVDEFLNGRLPCSLLETELIELARELDKEAARYRWLRDRYYASDFSYGSPPEFVICFRMPDDARVSANLDATLDEAMQLPQEQR